jgi:hypothetical protein
MRPSANGRQGSISQHLVAKRWQFPTILEHCISVFIYKKIEEAFVQVSTTLSGSSTNYLLSHYTTYSHTQTGATDPFNSNTPLTQIIYCRTHTEYGFYSITIGNNKVDIFN